MVFPRTVKSVSRYIPSVDSFFSMLMLFNFLLVTQKLALHESNISRYNAEFAEISTIGSGQFGSVHKCVNRLGEFYRKWIATDSCYFCFSQPN